MSDWRQIYRGIFTDEMEARRDEINDALRGPEDLLAKAIEEKNQALAVETEDLRTRLKQLEAKCGEEIRKMEIEFKDEHAALINERSRLREAQHKASEASNTESCCARSQKEGHWPWCIYCHERVD